MSKIKYRIYPTDYNNAITLVTVLSRTKANEDYPSNLDMLDTVINVVAVEIRKKSSAGKQVDISGKREF